MIGYKNEFFEILESAGRDPKKRHKLWKCLCKCGNTSILDTHSIKAKRIKSCGCSRKGKNKGNKFGLKHGLTQHKIRADPLYEMRNRILTRCYNAKKSDYPYYQGKGIRVCEEWIQHPKAFREWALANGWEKGLSIDRIDPDGNYEPGNCQFITQSENTKRRYKKLKLQKEKLPPKQIIKYCFRCKCTADSSSSCKYKELP